jgi:hypothetical protein
MKPAIVRPLFAALCGAPLFAQTYADLTESRNMPNPYGSVFQVEGGAIGTKADDEDPDVGLEDDISWDGRVYWRNGAVGGRRGVLEAYGGRDGFVGSWQDAKLIGDETVTRVELRARPWMFYRDGFYGRDDELRPNGFYEGSDYEAYVGFGKALQEGLYLEFGPYFRRLDFERRPYAQGAQPIGSSSPDTFLTPDDHNAYGGRLYVEQSSVQYDRRRGVPRAGYVLTLGGDREWNDSDKEFGVVGGYQTSLASAYWRARGRLDWYIPASDDLCWEIFGSGGWQDEKDRVQNSEGQRPLGNQWGDLQARLRIHLGNAFSITPYAQGQYSRTLSEDGFDSDKNFFFGGGVESWLHFGDFVSLHGYWSYLDNDNRPSIRIDRDVHGEQMFYLGMAIRFGVTRR